MAVKYKITPASNNEDTGRATATAQLDISNQDLNQGPKSSSSQPKYDIQKRLAMLQRIRESHEEVISTVTEEIKAIKEHLSNAEPSDHPDEVGNVIEHADAQGITPLTEAALKALTEMNSTTFQPHQGISGSRVRDPAEAFNLSAEKERLRLKSLKEAKRRNQQQDKNTQLNKLKEFGSNFRLKTRVPDDLAPILAKDRAKQLEIQSKAEEAAVKEEEKLNPSSKEPFRLFSLPADFDANGPLFH